MLPVGVQLMKLQIIFLDNYFLFHYMIFAECCFDFSHILCLGPCTSSCNHERPIAKNWLYVLHSLRVSHVMRAHLH